MFKGFIQKAQNYAIQKALEFTLTDDIALKFFGSGAAGYPSRAAYRECLWLYAAVNCIVRNIMTLPIKVKEKGKEGKELTSADDPIVDWFTLGKVMPIMTFQQWIEAYLINKLIYGEVFAKKEGLWRPGHPGEVWVLPPDTITERITNRQLVGWRYTSETKVVNLSLDQLNFERYYNPYDPIRGLNPVVVAKMPLTIERNANNTSNIFFKNGAVMPGLIEVERRLGDVGFNRLRAQWEEMVGGSEKSWTPPVLDGGAKWKERKQEIHGEYFAQTKEIAREEILAVYNVPPSEVGIFRYASYANADRQSYNFWVKNLYPKAIGLQSMINTFIMKDYDPSLEMHYDFSSIPELQEDIYKKALIAKTYWDMGIPVMQINKRLQLGFDEDELQAEQDKQDALAEQAAKPKLPAGNGAPPPPPTPNKPKRPSAASPKPKPKPADNNLRMKDIDDAVDFADSPPPVVMMSDFEKISADTRFTALWNIANNANEAARVKMRKHVSDLHYSIEQRMTKLLSEKFRPEYGMSVIDLIDYDEREHKQDVQKFFDTFYVEGFLLGATSVRLMLGKSMSGLTDSPFETLSDLKASVIDPNYISGIEDLEQRIFVIDGSIRRIIKAVKNQVKTAVENQMRLPDLMVAVRHNVFSEHVVAAVANRMATTEVSICTNAGRHAEIVRRSLFRQWVSSRKHGARASHALEELAGTKVPPFERYPITGLRYPADLHGRPEDVVNCSCIEVPVI